MTIELIDYNSLDGGTQFKIFDRVISEIERMNADEKNDRAMETLINFIVNETVEALAQNAGPCEECGLEDTEMEWQEFDRNFLCPDCGHVQ